MLLDELAAGTDPVEGSALAQALLARLARQARLTLVTTHYPELKEWASATDRVANAATGFDPDTHAPLYRIALGRPGTSHALQIAARLGLQADVVEDARAPHRPGAAAHGGAARRGRGGRAARDGGARRGRGGARRGRAARAAGRRARGASSRPRPRRCARRPAAAREAALLQAERDLAEARAELRRAAQRDPRRAPQRARARAPLPRAERRPRPSATAASARRPIAARAPSRRSGRCVR